MKQLSRLLPILLLASCIGNDIDLQNYYELRENDFVILGKIVDLEKVVDEAKSVEKPILFYFNSLACMYCRKMEEHVLDNRRIAKTIVEKFVLVPLVVDDKTRLSHEKWKISEITGKKMKNVGNFNSNLQIEICKCGSQPHFVVVDSEKEILGKMGYTSDKREFLQFLKSSIKKYKQTAN